MVSFCPYCGSEEVTYLGVDDGGGDYGSALCDAYACDVCHANWEADCVEVDNVQQSEIAIPDAGEPRDT